MKTREYILKKIEANPKYTFKKAAQELRISERHMNNIVCRRGAGKALAIRIKKWSKGEVSILEAMGIDD